MVYTLSIEDHYEGKKDALYDAQSAIDALREGDSFFFTFHEDSDSWIQVSKAEGGALTYETGAGNYHDVGSDPFTEEQAKKIDEGMSEQTNPYADFCFVLVASA